MPMKGCTIGRASFITLRSIGKIRFRYQRATSGKASSCRVSPVGAQSTTRTSNWRVSAWRRIHIRLAISSIPGGVASSSAMMSSTPWELKSVARYSWIFSQWPSISWRAFTSWA